MHSTHSTHSRQSLQCLILLVAAGLSIPAPVAASNEPTSQSTTTPVPVTWLSDYRAACDEARASSKLVLVWFCDAAASPRDDAFQREVLSQPSIERRIAQSCIAVQVPLDAQAPSEGKQVALLKHEAFAEMQGRAGLAVVDLTDKASPHYGRVVSVYPFARRCIAADELIALLDLPAGSLTERTLIFAVCTHRDRPQSAASGHHRLLAHETSQHSQHQANLTLQGHHQWERRFHGINARLPGTVAYEVCAESWPGQPLVEAAEECVDSWRQSSGHWGQVSRQAEHFGYDMRRGRNGVWYATGIFARRR